MTCPNCQAALTPQDFTGPGGVMVCPTCARSLVREPGQARVARAADLLVLTPGQIADLRQARPAAWRNDVRARHAQIVSTKT